MSDIEELLVKYLATHTKAEEKIEGIAKKAEEPAIRGRVH